MRTVGCYVYGKQNMHIPRLILMQRHCIEIATDNVWDEVITEVKKIEMKSHIYSCIVGPVPQREYYRHDKNSLWQHFTLEWSAGGKVCFFFFLAFSQMRVNCASCLWSKHYLRSACHHHGIVECVFFYSLYFLLLFWSSVEENIYHQQCTSRGVHLAFSP